MDKAAITLVIANPRGFCAGVDRAIQIVELALERFGAPVYVRHEIVHNRYVVSSLEEKGAVFIEELEEAPQGAAVVFSAHGVPKSVPEDARSRRMIAIDATCPLFSKVHREAERHFERGHHSVLVGHAGHPEVVGTMGQVPSGAMSLIETAEDARAFSPPTGASLAYLTQTTLSLDDTKEIIGVLKSRFPEIGAPKKEDICYATTNRQEAVKAIAPRCDHLLVIGAPNSSNSLRLVEVARREGCAASLIQRADDIPWDALRQARTVGLSAGASAPEILKEEVVTAFRERYDVAIEEVRLADETIRFRLPAILSA